MTTPFDFDTFLTDTLKQAAVNSYQTGSLLPAHENWATNAEMSAAYQPYNANLYAFLWHSIQAHMLIRVAGADPELAAKIAAEVEQFGEMGDYSEWVWQWLDERGVDVDAYVAERIAESDEWKSKPYRGYVPPSDGDVA